MSAVAGPVAVEMLALRSEVREPGRPPSGLGRARYRQLSIYGHTRSVVSASSPSGPVRLGSESGLRSAASVLHSSGPSNADIDMDDDITSFLRMPITRSRGRALYQRGAYRLEWDRRADGSLRSPFLAVFWYDAKRRRIRSSSTGTKDVEEAKRWLDALYLEQTSGHAVCPSCHRPWDATSGYLLTDAISTYLTLHASGLPSEGAIASRLGHVVEYLEATKQAGIACDQVDEPWIRRFREWSVQQPIVSPTGKQRQRSLSTTENSVLQLAAVINDAHRRRNAKHPAAFRPQQVKDLNRTPEHRSDIAEIAAMFRYCVQPKADTEAWRKRLVRERAALHRFLIFSVATLARPDAAHDASVDPKRRQWNSKARIFSLNPKGRRQTKKRRPTVKVAWQVAHHLDKAKGYFVGPKSVRKAWDGMAAELSLPNDGEGGMKLMRRSMAHLLRQPSRGVPVGQIEMMLGHRPIDSTSELYAPFDPSFLAEAVTAIEGIIDEIETAVPGAFHRTCAGEGVTAIPMVRG